jgi:hypothetical protein
MEQAVAALKSYLPEDKVKKACLAAAALGILAYSFYTISSK